MQMVVFAGVQGSGKSTFFAQHFLHTHVRISLDVVRTRHRERALIRACLDLEQRLVVDNTNPRGRARPSPRHAGASCATSSCR